MEEVSDWHDGVLRSIALNIRYFVNGRIVKQQWDVFDRSDGGFAAWRVQAKTRDGLAKEHPDFARMWDPSTFGLPWLETYRAAHPERRADLDLPAGEAPADVASPFAEAFYRVRTAPPHAQRVALFLPGNKSSSVPTLASHRQLTSRTAHMYGACRSTAAGWGACRARLR